MNPQFVVDFAQESMKLTLYLSAPMLGFGLVAGLVVSIFQAVTSIQEMTLTFIPKIVAVFLSIIIFLPWLLQLLLNFTAKILTDFSQWVQ